MKHAFTKIVATLGPASNTKEVIRSLALEGVSVFRLNFSHGTHDDHRRNVGYIREVEEEIKSPLGILCDLQGPKLRIGMFKNDDILLGEGDKFRLDMLPEDGDETRVCLPHPEIFKAMVKGMELLLNDGIIRLKVDSFGEDYADTTVISGGRLSNKKGVNVPGVPLPISALTEKDRIDLEAALDMGVDYIGLSFVQTSEDVLIAKYLIQNRAAIVSKIEKPSALEHLEEIIRLSDGIMIARGDLGVELPPEKVPLLQKRIISACRRANKPVIVATQMLESMVVNPTPTRAEVSDVANAVFDAVDAVMLSAETAAGKYPTEAVRLMDKIILETEAGDLYQKFLDASRLPPEPSVESAVTASARITAETVLDAKAIVSYTITGSTTARISRERPNLPILCLTPDIKVARRMALFWGVDSAISGKINILLDVAEMANDLCKEMFDAKPDDKMIVTAGVPFNVKGNTNIMLVANVK